jgi:hypothetical protein
MPMRQHDKTTGTESIQRVANASPFNTATP